jgi:hypothetical protein
MGAERWDYYLAQLSYYLAAPHAQDLKFEQCFPPWFRPPKEPDDE